MPHTSPRWDPRDQPSYTLKEAALYVAIPASTVRAWTMGQLYPTSKEGRKLAPPLLVPARKAPPVLSFWNLVEIYVLASIRREHAVSMPRVRKALKRIDRDPKGLATRMFPWIDSPSEPRSVEIDPARAFGRLVVAGTGIPTESIAERFRAGDSIGDLAADFRLTQEQIESALRWEQRASVA